jgi:hypothetical protein
MLEERDESGDGEPAGFGALIHTHRNLAAAITNDHLVSFSDASNIY